MSAQLALYNQSTTPASPVRRPRAARAPLCASCQAREARYGFRPAADDPMVGRPRTLCFECFRAEIARRQEAARTVQVELPLERTLDQLHRRRRQAQMAARRAMAIR
jgi:hypothetical protein